MIANTYCVTGATTYSLMNEKESIFFNALFLHFFVIIRSRKDERLGSDHNSYWKIEN